MRNPDGLLMIEPTCAPTVPLIDDITRKTTALLRAVIDPDTRSRYRGIHRCTGADCRAHSDNADHAIRVGGMNVDHGTVGPDVEVQTNSLIVHYVACHRADVSDDERDKIERLFRHLCLDEQTPTSHEVTGTIVRVARPEDLPPEMGGTRPRRLR